MKACPYCGEMIQDAARKCRYCGEQLGPGRSRTRKKSSSSSSGLIIALVVCGVLGIGFLILLALLLPAIGQAREAARAAKCKNNLKQIGLAMHNYLDIHRVFPPGHTVDANGRPYHGWRVYALPYLEQQNLYEQFDLDQPWDAPQNLALLDVPLSNYKCPANPDQESATTDYVSIFGEDTVFTTSGVGIREITDGTSNTIMIGEGHALDIPWPEPRDVPLDGLPPLGAANGFSSGHARGTHFLFGDGSVQALSDDVDPEVFRSLMQRNDGGAPALAW